jgi:hypothetical protein
MCDKPSSNDIYAKDTPDYQNVLTGCATGTIGPGTYLFVVRHTSPGLGPDSFTGAANAISNTRIIVFDHPVSYKSIHINASLWNWIDLDHTTFTTASYHVPLGNYAKNGVYSNISGFPGNTTTGAVLHVYELK